MNNRFRNSIAFVGIAAAAGVFFVLALPKTEKTEGNRTKVPPSETGATDAPLHSGNHSATTAPPVQSDLSGGPAAPSTPSVTVDPPQREAPPVSVDAPLLASASPEQIRSAEALRVALDGSLAEHERNIALDELRAVNHPKLTASLLQIAGNSSESPRFRAFALQHMGLSLAETGRLSAPEREQLTATLRQELAQGTGLPKREALLALARLRDASAEPVVSGGLGDPAWAAERDVILTILVERNQRDRLPEIRPLLGAAQAEVRLAAAVAVSTWGDAESRAALETMSKADPEAYVRTAAGEALRRLNKALAAPLTNKPE